MTAAISQVASAIEASFADLATAAQSTTPTGFMQLLSEVGSPATASGASGSNPTSGGFSAAPSAAAAATVSSLPLLVPVSTAAGQAAQQTGGAAAAAVSAAESQLGDPYVWGGSTPATGFDCSGLVQWAYAQAGVSLPRTAAEQQQVGVRVPSLAQATPGDLVFYGQPAYHVGIYLGNGLMIDAPEAGQTVSIAPVGNPTEIRNVAAPVASGQSGLAPVFAQASAAYNLPPSLLPAVASVESGMNPQAVSPAGAEGLMQIMPQTAQGLGINPFDPVQAIYGAAKLLSEKLAAFGSVPLALAAYNAGDGAVEKYGGIPPYQQTQSYVQMVMSKMGVNGAG